MTSGALIAAAGASGRMGFSKLLLAPRDGLPLVVTTARAFIEAGVARVFVTRPPVEKLRAEDVDAVDRVFELLAREGAILVDNAHWERGLIGSVWTVLDGNPALEALFLTPVDVPGISSELVRALAGKASWAAPSVDNRPGHPLMLPRNLFARVRAHDGDGGVRAALDGIAGQMVEWKNLSVVTSVDTPSDAARAGLLRWG